ncbi:hypothetical protein Q3G72_028026 [Acer saccharum]|nr:hypothetical protein Q3G72_028026 [Acer saccharum]
MLTFSLSQIGNSSKQPALSTHAQTRQSNNIEVGSSSTHHAHIQHNNSQTRQPNTGTVNRVLWFPNTQTSNQGYACHDNIGSQPFTPNAPRSSQRLEGTQETGTSDKVDGFWYWYDGILLVELSCPFMGYAHMVQVFC